jgi:FAD:protein FMN transferase
MTVRNLHSKIGGSPENPRRVDLRFHRSIRIVNLRQRKSGGGIILYPKFSAVVLFLITIGIPDAAGQDFVGQSPFQESDESKPGQTELDRHEFEFPSMGTLVHVTAYCASESQVEKAIQAAQRRVIELAAILTDYDPASETRQLSGLAAKSPTKVSDPLWEVLQSADDWNKQSGGAFDSSLGSLTQLWRKYRRAGRVPTKEDVLEAKKMSGWKAVRLNAPDKTVTIADERIRLDFGAIGKGYIADQAYLTLVEHGIKHSLVNISGNMRCGLPPPNKTGWTIAIAPIEQNGEAIQKVQIANQAIATSGDLWQYTLVDGVKRSHILDPQTGYGVVGPLAVTVIAPTAIDADALATIGCVLEWDKFLKLIEAHENRSALRASRADKELAILRSSKFPVDAK